MPDGRDRPTTQTSERPLTSDNEDPKGQ